MELGELESADRQSSNECGKQNVVIIMPNDTVKDNNVVRPNGLRRSCEISKRDAKSGNHDMSVVPMDCKPVDTGQRNGSSPIYSDIDVLIILRLALSLPTRRFQPPT